MSFQICLALAFNVALIGVCGTALIMGGRPERLGATINFIASFVTTGLRLVDRSYYAPSETVILTIDLLVVLSFFWLSVATIRFWPIWATGFALANLFMSLCGALLPGIPLFAYHTGLGIYAYLALGALALGTLRLPRDAAPYVKNGSRRSWLQHHQATT